jgi:hypothetical protein
MKSTGQHRNITDESTIALPISVGSSVSVTLVDAQLIEAQPLFAIWIYNDGNSDLWLKPQAFGVDNLKNGIPIFAGERVNILEFNKNYIGEWSGIMNAGAARDVYVTYW